MEYLLQQSIKVLLISDSDLDGSTSALIISKLCNQFSYQIEHLHTTVKKFRTDLTAFTRNHKLSDYKIVYVLDIDTHNDYEFIDYDNAIIIDHHKSHFDNKHVYKHANVENVQVYSSCAKLCYKVFQDELSWFTPELKKLILLADDYDSYELKVKQSLMLNIVYWSYVGNRYEKFIEDFSEGFTGFTSKHTNMINIWKNKFKNIIEHLSIYQTEIEINEKKYKCCCILGDFAINELAAYVFKKYKCDVVMIINSAAKRVYVRRNKDCDADMSKYVLSICEKESGGHEAAAGCKLTDKIMEMTKSFKRIA